MREINKKIGGANKEKLLSSLPSAAGTGIGNAFEFERMVGSVVKQMHHACEGTSLPLSEVKLVTYVACSDLESDADQDNFNDVHLLLIDDFSILLPDIENRIILVDQNGVSGAISKCQYSGLANHARALNQLSLHDHPTVIFQLNVSKMSLYRHGIQTGADDHEDFGMIDGLLLGGNLIDALNRFDSGWVNSPECYIDLWTDPKKYVPCAETEHVIQKLMHLSLFSADKGTLTIDEVNSSDGRADLWVKPKRDINKSAIIELKVLRSFCCPRKEPAVPSPVSDATNIENAQEVVRQAAAYRDQLDASRGLACIYDMRKPGATLIAITSATTLAEQNSVELRSTIVYPNVKAKRIQKYGMQSKS